MPQATEGMASVEHHSTQYRVLVSWQSAGSLLVWMGTLSLWVWTLADICAPTRLVEVQEGRRQSRYSRHFRQQALLLYMYYTPRKWGCSMSVQTQRLEFPIHMWRIAVLIDKHVRGRWRNGTNSTTNSYKNKPLLQLLFLWNERLSFW